MACIASVSRKQMSFRSVRVVSCFVPFGVSEERYGKANPSCESYFKFNTMSLDISMFAEATHKQNFPEPESRFME